MKARIAYLTSPAPNVYMLNFQQENGTEFSIEISKGHLANIIVDGASLALRDQYQNRVPATPQESVTNERERAGAGT